MLATRQIARLIGVAILFWLIAAIWIRSFPAALSGSRGDLGFVLSVPVCWGCIVLVRRLAGLDAHQLVAGTALVVSIATLLDAAALRWAHSIYAESEPVCRLGAAWLLWGYGLSLGIALLMQCVSRKTSTVCGAARP